MEKRCVNYVGLACVDRNCPMALHNEYPIMEPVDCKTVGIIKAAQTVPWPEPNAALVKKQKTVATNVQNKKNAPPMTPE